MGETISDKEKQLENIEKLSQELFGKPSKEIKYLLLTNYIHQQLLDEELTRTGLYQWINVFKGEIKYPRDVVDYNKYDIIQINMSSQDLPFISDVKRKITNKNTKIVVNNDYTTEQWQMAFDYIPNVYEALQHPDMLFGTEYFQTTALSEISERKCFVIPHPADIKRLKSLPKLPKQDIISVIWRRYDCRSLLPALVARNNGLTTRLIGYDKTKDPRMFATTTHFDYVLEGTNYFEFCKQLSESKVIYDPFTYHSYSRATVDTAALGIPVVVSDRTQSGKICYPFTRVDPYDITKARQLIKRILEDEEFRNKVIKTALENSEFYNHKNSLERYLMALNESIKFKKENGKKDKN